MAFVEHISDNQLSRETPHTSPSGVSPGVPTRGTYDIENCHRNTLRGQYVMFSAINNQLSFYNQFWSRCCIYKRPPVADHSVRRYANAITCHQQPLSWRQDHGPLSLFYLKVVFYHTIFKQGKSEGFDSCDRPSNLAQIWSKSSIFCPLWPWNLMDGLGKQ